MKRKRNKREAKVVTEEETMRRERGEVEMKVVGRVSPVLFFVSTD